jgi:hypothetical protein
MLLTTEDSSAILDLFGPIFKIEQFGRQTDLQCAYPHRGIVAELHDLKSSSSSWESGRIASCLGQTNKGYHQTRSQTRDKFLASPDFGPLAGVLAKHQEAR